MALPDSLQQMVSQYPGLQNHSSIQSSLATLGQSPQNALAPFSARKKAAKPNPALFGLGLVPGIASYIAPQQTSDFFSGLKNFLFGGQESPHSDEQLFALQQLLSMGLGGLQNPQQGFEGIEQLARKQFKEQTIPTLSERFTAMGGGRPSSGTFTQQLGQAGASLESNLAAMRAQYGQQNQSNALRMLLAGLQPQSQRVPGFFEQAAPTAGRLGVSALLGGF